MIWIVFGVLFLVLIGLFLFAMLYEFISKKHEFQPILKKYLVHVLVVIFLFALITPLILYFFGLFNKDRALQNSDILGYYGAVIGGIVTVLGVYWTLNYESKKSKEERKREREKEEEARKRERELLKEEREHEFQMRLEERKENNIPVFNFTMKSYSESHDLDDYDYSIYGENLKDKFNNIYTNLKQLELSNTNLGEEEYELESELVDTMDETAREIKEKLNKTQELRKWVNQELKRKLCKKNINKLSLTFSLNINNIGLQSAILYSIIYVPEGPMSSLKGSCLEQDLKYLSVPKGKETKIYILLESYFKKKDDFSTEFKEVGYFLLKYTDLYRNFYEYYVPIKIKKVGETQSIIPTDLYDIKIDKVNLPILPKKISEVHNESNFLMSN